MEDSKVQRVPNDSAEILPAKSWTYSVWGQVRTLEISSRCTRWGRSGIPTCPPAHYLSKAVRETSNAAERGKECTTHMSTCGCLVALEWRRWRRSERAIFRWREEDSHWTKRKESWSISPSLQREGYINTADYAKLHLHWFEEDSGAPTLARSSKGIW